MKTRSMDSLHLEYETLIVNAALKRKKTQGFYFWNGEWYAWHIVSRNQFPIVYLNQPFTSYKIFE